MGEMRLLVLIPGGRFSGLYDPFAVWEATRDGVTAAGATPDSARERLAAKVAAGKEE